ncbi:hypothetical protein AVEN_228275-1 [Araneus ventricosus]|uniref:Uncharacterized protein n=1 Tax=Araneus ventricosus TaxID=182803 RepID=A0A4Y2EA63_ARAVE|nr:hypothetical protein AVEN_228275-1 [Araneus ventricosus]
MAVSAIGLFGRRPQTLPFISIDCNFNVHSRVMHRDVGSTFWFGGICRRQGSPNLLLIVNVIAMFFCSCGTVQLQIIAIDIDTLIPERRKEVDGFNVETPGFLTDPVPISSSSDSLTDAWTHTVYKLCHNQVFVDYVMHSSFAYRQLNSNFMCGDPTILSYDLIHSRNRGTIGHNVRLPRRGITLTPPEYGAPCETLLSIRLFHPTINM